MRLRRGSRARAPVSLVGFLPLLLAGCFLSGLRGCIDSEGSGHVEGEFETALCQVGEETGGVSVRCPFVFLGSEEVESSLTLLTPAETFFLLFLDPLVVQFPDGASNFSGVFTKTNPPGMGALSVQTTNCIATAPGRRLCAEPGHKLVIFELPSGMETGSFQFSLDFTVTPAQSIEVKPILTGKVITGGRTFYPVLIPCIDDFASAPSVTIPQSMSIVDLSLPLAGVQPCQGVVDLRVRSAGVPASSPLLLASLVVLLAALGAFVLRRRRA